MVKWKFWQRSADTTTEAELPPEVQEYYESTRRGRKGVAILLAIVTVIVTLLLAAVLYFAGRYVWRTFIDNNDEPAPISQQEVAPTDQPATTAPDSNKDSDSNSGATNSDEDNTGTSSTSTSDSNDGSNNSDSTNDNDNDNGKETSPSSPNEVPDTGPGEVFAIAILAAVASGIGYELLARRNKSTQ